MATRAKQDLFPTARRPPPRRPRQRTVFSLQRRKVIRPPLAILIVDVERYDLMAGRSKNQACVPSAAEGVDFLDVFGDQIPNATGPLSFPVDEARHYRQPELSGITLGALHDAPAGFVEVAAARAAPAPFVSSARSPAQIGGAYDPLALARDLLQKKS
jgi:hypothetical protein